MFRVGGPAYDRCTRDAHEGTKPMHDQAMVWNTDAHLRVTSLTARLRDFAGLGPWIEPVHVSALWGDRDPFPVLAHQWALDGETLAFEASVGGTQLYFELAPLFDATGTPCGVTGRAVDLVSASPLAAGALLAAEHAAGIGMWHEDLRIGTLTISPGLELMIGPDAARAHIRKMLDSHAGEDAYSIDHRVECDRARVREMRERMRTVYDERGVAIARIGTLIDISDLKEREAHLSHLAMHDALTHLPNRAALDERLRAAFARSRRNDHLCAAFFIDLDNFKRINDERGHAFGDRTLMAVADRFVRHLRASDTVARLGGDEFVVVIDDLYTVEAARDAARKLLRIFDEPFFIGDEALRISASIGVATSAEYDTPCGLIAAADTEMYAAKRNGGNGIKLASSCQVRSFPVQHPYATRESA